MENLKEILGAIIVIAPLVIFLAVMWMAKRAISKEQIKLGDLLIETDTLPKPDFKKKGDAEEEPTPPIVKRSASRLMLFLSGITSLVLATCITTYYFYMKIYSVGNGALDLSDFTNVLLALGVGVIPYSVNQVKKIRL
jgi:flagellar basal body-associated protein FliL